MFEDVLKFYHGFPKEGINFVDIMPFMQNRQVFTSLMGEIGSHVTAPSVASPEARAFLFSAPLLTTDCGVSNVIPFRKKGKLPFSGDDLQDIEIMKEYGPDHLYFRKSDIAAGKAEDGCFHITIIDDGRHGRRHSEGLGEHPHLSRWQGIQGKSQRIHLHSGA